MDGVEVEYSNYWETMRFYEEIDSRGFDETVSGLYDSSSPEGPGAASSCSPATNSIAVERHRRRKLNESLYGLRSVVPHISKMDKASIVKDAIAYVQELQEEERRMTAEVAELEAAKGEKSSDSEMTQDDHLVVDKGSKKRGRSSLFVHPIQVMELRVCEVGERSQLISITCNRMRGTLMKVCEIFESLNLKIMSANITSFCGNLLHTLCVEGGDMNSVQLKEKIEAAIAEHDAMAYSPMSSTGFWHNEDQK